MMSPPVVIGESALNAALAVVCPVPPLAIGNAVPERVTARVPEDVIGDPETDKNAGTVIATLVTVPPAAGVAHAGTPPETVKT
jgi:hypothetical protein